MRKGKDVIGKPIVALEGGEKIDTVHDIIFDQETNQVLAFVVDEGGWFHGARVLPIDKISSIGPDAVIIADKRDVVKADNNPAVKAILERNNVLKGTKLMTTDGKNLGKLADVYFDEDSGQVVGYEVTGGIFSDVATGRSFVPAPRTITIGEDVAFVPPETAQEMEEQPAGGIKGAVGSVAANAKEVAVERQRDFVIGKTASREVLAPDGRLIVSKDEVITPADADKAETHGAMGALFAAAGGGVLKDAVSSVKERGVDDTLGKRVGTDVRADGGILVAAEGQIVTQAVIDRAKRYEREAQLVAAVYQSRAKAAGQTVADGAASVKEGAANLLDRAKESLSDARERAADANEQRRINAALGRPVTRVILDQQDNVILNLGELITHKAVDEARVAGVLPVLLDSVYTATPDLTVDDLRAPEPGRASLEQEHAREATEPEGMRRTGDAAYVSGRDTTPTPPMTPRPTQTGAHAATTPGVDVPDTVSGAPSSDDPVVDPLDPKRRRS
jgi:uncharacterized protein YrrD